MKLTASRAIRSCALDIGVALILALAAAGSNVLWVQHNRFGLALTIDEAGYMSQAIAYANALKYGGVSAWFAALSYPTKFAPLSPIVSSVMMAKLGINENIAFYTHILFYAGLVLITFWWVRERSSRGAAIAAALLVASLPDIVLYTRTYQYGVPTAFFFLLANFAYFKADRFSSWGWSTVLGGALGLMLLSRTMSIAFLPAFGLVWLLDSGKVLSRRLGQLALSVTVFLLVALPWYALNFKEIFGYLFSFGYGVHSAEYGMGATSVLSLGYLASRIQGLMDSLYLFHFVVVFLLFWFCVLRQVRTWMRARQIEDRSVIVPTLIVLLCVIILFSSKNRGSGFEIPLFSVMIFCVACTIDVQLERRALRTATYLGLSLCAIVVGYYQSTTSACDSAPDLVVRPLLSRTPIRVCDSYVDQYIRAGDGIHRVDRSKWSRISREDQKEWRRVSSELANRLHDVDASKSMVIYLTRNRLVNVNTVMLEFIKQFSYILPAAQIEPGTLVSDADYAKWFADATRTKTCAVVMMSDVGGDFFPRPRLDVLKKIVEDRGFVLATRVPTPVAGTYAELWTSKGGCSDGQ
jgi:hypothetical protein